MQNGKNAEIVRRIQESGYLREFDSGTKIHRPKPTIECNPYESYAFAFRRGMGFILDLRISSEAKILIRDFGDVELEKEYCDVQWLESNADIYRFCGGPEFPRDIVLNHRRGATVIPGKPLEGFLLGRSNRTIPSIYSGGFALTFEFSILDGFDIVHTAQLLARVDEHLHTEIKRPIRRSLFASKKPTDNVPDPPFDDHSEEVCYGSS